MASAQTTMANKPLNGILKRIRTLAEVQTGRALTDRELLARFVADKDEAAFTVLIERHGPMVFGVCQRALRNAHDAEDACQATFLVFARKADSIRKSASLSSWLHGVACRIAANVKRERIRAKRREQRAAVPIEEACGSANWHEMRTILDEEVAALPERFRGPLLLCYWEGRTRDEAALQLGMTAGKLHGLLERGRERLRDRLTKRGVTLSAALCSSLLVASATSAALNPTLVVASTKAALLLAAGASLTSDVVSTHVITLTKEALQTMFIAKLKVVTASILCAGLTMALIGGSLAGIGSAQNPNARLRAVEQLTQLANKPESDEAFIRRMSKDLRGTEPSPAEIHFFVSNKDAGRRQKLIDLFIQERQTKQNDQRMRAVRAIEDILKPGQGNAKPDAKGNPTEADQQRALEAELQRIQAELERLRALEAKQKSERDRLADPQNLIQDLKARLEVEQQARAVVQERLQAEAFYRRVIAEQELLAKAKKISSIYALQSSFLRSLLDFAREKKDVSEITQAYFDGLTAYVTAYPKASDAPDAMLQIELVHRARGNTNEANAWREKLHKEFPDSRAAKMKQAGHIHMMERGDAPTFAETLRIYLEVNSPSPLAPAKK
jgi:RNA polymerase sigma factor (sigma-70 family)